MQYLNILFLNQDPQVGTSESSVWNIQGSRSKSKYFRSFMRRSRSRYEFHRVLYPIILISIQGTENQDNFLIRMQVYKVGSGCSEHNMSPSSNLSKVSTCNFHQWASDGQSLKNETTCYGVSTFHVISLILKQPIDITI